MFDSLTLRLERYRDLVNYGQQLTASNAMRFNLASTLARGRIRPFRLTTAPAGVNPPGGGGGDFSQLFGDAVGRLEQTQRDASARVDRFLAGETSDLIPATRKAELPFELFAQGRNKVVQAYQEVMRMQV